MTSFDENSIVDRVLDFADLETEPKKVPSKGHAISIYECIIFGLQSRIEALREEIANEDDWKAHLVTASA